MVKPNSQNDVNTREIILAAARKEFIENGLRGARMQEIADRAQINKALLHYHFRDKEGLYKAAVQSIVDEVIPNPTSAASPSDATPARGSPQRHYKVA
jgi:AcrR family transcriptional regulator